jgi:acyl carrier protein
MQDVTPTEIKAFIVRTLDLEDTSAADIGDHQPLFQDGLGLDSIDAFELGLALKKVYHVDFGSENTAAFAPHFRTAATLAAFVSAHRQVTI